MRSAFPLAQKLGSAPPASSRRVRGWAFVFIAWALIIAALVAFSFYSNYRSEQKYKRLPASALQSLEGTTVVKAQPFRGSDCCAGGLGGVSVWLTVKGVTGPDAVEAVVSDMTLTGWARYLCREEPATTPCLSSDGKWAKVEPTHHGEQVLVIVARGPDGWHTFG